MALGPIGPISNLINSDLNINTAANHNATGAIAPSGEPIEKPRVIENASETEKKHPGRKSSPQDCETYKHRKYIDGSNEADVSFKAAAHISPESSGSRVMAHEREHVANAYQKASQNNGKVISAVVALHTAVCPECGRTYVEGGTTTTKIRYMKDDNGYAKAINNANDAKYNGTNVDFRG